MNENNNFETIEIPDILLELNGLRTANKIVSAEKILEAENILASGRFVEAGIGSWLKNMFVGKLTPAEVQAIIQRVEKLFTSSTSSAEKQLYTQKIIELSKSLTHDTKGFIKRPFQKGMADFWQEIDDLAKNAEKAGVGKNQAQIDSLAEGFINLGHGIDTGLAKGGFGTNAAVAWISKLARPDKELLKKHMSGVVKIGENGLEIPLTYEEFFTSGYLNAGGGAGKGNIFMKDPHAVTTALANLSKDVGASAKLKGWLNLASQIAAVVVVPQVAMAGGTMWAFGQGIKNAPSQSDYDQVENQSYPKSETATTPGGTTNPSGGLGGTTNGNNVGGLGGQYSPQPNNGWNPPKPNLQNNPNDWLPTNTSDYYNLVDRKSDLESDNIRFAQLKASGIESVDETVRNVLTILEQGAPGPETLNVALRYLRNLNQKIQPLLDNFYNQLDSENNNEPKQVNQA